MRQMGKLALIVSTVAAVAVLLATAGVCRYYRIYSIGSWESYQAMASECHPVWQDYQFGRVTAGDDVEDVILRTQPERVDRKGRWVTLHYQDGGFSGVSAYAYDDKLVLACAYSWRLDTAVLR